MAIEEQFEKLKPIIANYLKANMQLRISIWQSENPQATPQELEEKLYETLTSVMIDTRSMLPKEFGDLFDKGVEDFRNVLISRMN